MLTIAAMKKITKHLKNTKKRIMTILKILNQWMTLNFLHEFLFF